MKTKDSILVLFITAAISIIGNFVGYKVSIIEAIPGMLILVLLAALGIILAKIIPVKIPQVAYIVTLASILTIPGVPGSEAITQYTSKVNFLSLATPILAYAGIYTGKNIEDLKKTGWKIVVLGLFVMTGTYVSSAIVAHVVLKLMGQI